MCLSVTSVDDLFHGLYVYFFRINFTAVVVDLNFFICRVLALEDSLETHAIGFSNENRSTYLNRNVRLWSRRRRRFAFGLARKQHVLL